MTKCILLINHYTAVIQMYSKHSRVFICRNVPYDKKYVVGNFFPGYLGKGQVFSSRHLSLLVLFYSNLFSLLMPTKEVMENS